MNELPTPPHIKKALADLSTLGIPPEAMPHVTAALQLVTDYYHATTQVARADKMKRDRDRTQDELETVSSDLLAARKEIQELREQVRALPQLKELAMKEAQAHADKQTGRFMSAATQLRTIFFEAASILNGSEADPDKKIQAAKSILARVLSTSSNRKHSMLGYWLLKNEMPAE